MTDLSFRLKDLENKERHIDCVLPADMILDALEDMDIDVSQSSLRLVADVTKHNVTVLCDGKLTGDVARPILGREAKVAALHDITAHLGITPADVIAVGDGANDLGMLHLAGAGVALHAKPSVAAECDIRINHGDLTALLYIQGYSVGEFAR